MSAKEILYNKAIEQKMGGFLSGQVGWIVEAMEEYAAEKDKLLSVIKEFHKDFIYIVIDLEHLGSDEWEFAYTIKYLPKEAQNLKRRATSFKEVNSFVHAGGATYSGAWDSYDECLEKAIAHARKIKNTFNTL